MTVWLTLTPPCKTDNTNTNTHTHTPTKEGGTCHLYTNTLKHAAHTPCLRWSFLVSTVPCMRTHAPHTQPKRAQRKGYCTLLRRADLRLCDVHANFCANSANKCPPSGPVEDPRHMLSTSESLRHGSQSLARTQPMLCVLDGTGQRMLAPLALLEHEHDANRAKELRAQDAAVRHPRFAVQI